VFTFVYGLFTMPQAMESSISTDDLDSTDKPTAPVDVATVEHHLSSPPVVRDHLSSPSSPSVVRERCAMCGATLASDQRYCVECGQRCSAARLPFTNASQQHAQQASNARPGSARLRMSINSTLIAGVGILLLAMGVGILIGRSAAGSTNTKSPAIQVVTVPGASGAAAATGTESQPTSTATTTKPTASGAAAATKAAKSAPKASAPPPAKVVKVGSPGKGPGYQHGHFTGNFFGE
jgi:hypothetical protein